MTNASMISTVMMSLSKTHRVLAPDLPGFGDSEKPGRRVLIPAFFARWLIAFMDATGIERALPRR